MKIKKVVLSTIIISIILITIPTGVFAWLEMPVYYGCNKVNMCISWLMKIVAAIIGITYITVALGYNRHSKQEKKQKTKNILKWLIITIVQIAILLSGATLVTKIGIEPYWYPSGKRYQFDEIDGYISNGIRIIAGVAIIAYIVTAIIYFVKSKKENNQKIINLAKWQMMTAAIVIGLLLLATNW